MTFKRFLKHLSILYYLLFDRNRAMFRTPRICPSCARGAFTVHGSETLTRLDRKTFTETNGSIVSGKADRAVNLRTNTEQISINQNSSELPDRLCVMQKVFLSSSRVRMHTSGTWYILLYNI